MYPKYARSERIADGAMHAVGVTLAVLGASVVLGWERLHLPPAQQWALAIYAVALIGTFVASAFYHMTPWESLRPLLRRIDHAAIYVKIAGTYTPLAVLMGNGFGYALLALVWLAAVAGAVHKLFFWRLSKPGGTAIYLAMGWMGAAVFWALWPSLPGAALALLVAGGALYSLGVVFFSWENLKFAMPIWHFFVLVASVCIFTAILMSQGGVA